MLQDILKLTYKALNLITTQLFFGYQEPGSKESPYVKVLTLFYKRTGIWRTQTVKELNWFKFTTIVILLSIGICNGSYMFYLNYGNFEINTDVLLHTAVSVHSLFVYLTFVYKHESIKWLVSVLNKQFNEFESVFKEKSNLWSVEEKITLIQMNLFYYLVFVTDIVFIMQTNFYSFDLQQSKLLYPLWFPFDTTTELYYLALVIQVLIFLIHMNVHIMSAGLFAGCVNLYGAINDIMVEVFKHIHNVDKFKVGQTGEVLTKCEVEDVQDGLLHRCIRTHVLLKRFENEVISIYGVIILEVVLASELLICFSGYQFIQAIQNQDAQRVFKSLFLVAIMTVQLYVYCTFGQTLQSKNSLFTLGVYNSDWYKCSESFKKSFLIFLINTTKPVSVSLSGVIPATLHTFLQTLKAAFSYLNLLLVMSKQ